MMSTRVPAPPLLPLLPLKEATVGAAALLTPLLRLMAAGGAARATRLPHRMPGNVACAPSHVLDIASDLCLGLAR